MCQYVCHSVKSVFTTFILAVKDRESSARFVVLIGIAPCLSPCRAGEKSVRTCMRCVFVLECAIAKLSYYRDYPGGHQSVSRIHIWASIYTHYVRVANVEQS